MNSWLIAFYDFSRFSQFQQLAQQGNFVPVYQEWVADLDTPVSAWYKVCAGQPLPSVGIGGRRGEIGTLQFSGLRSAVDFRG